MYMYNYVEMARVTGVPMSYLLARGQSIKVFSQILRKSRTKNLVVPNMKVGVGGRVGLGGGVVGGRLLSGCSQQGSTGNSSSSSSTGLRWFKTANPLYCF
jgi:hypothetical protein